MRISDWSSDVCSSDLLSRKDWDYTLAASLTSVFMCCKWAAPLIAKSGGGAIVNTNTMSAHFGIAGMSAYLSAKYALVEFTKILALELAPDNIRVNAFSPGMTLRSEEHTSELQSLMRISYAVFCLKKKNRKTNT